MVKKLRFNGEMKEHKCKYYLVKEYKIISELTKKDKAKAMRNGKMKMAKEGCTWTIEDDMILREMFADGEDTLDMALALDRIEPAVQ